MNQERQQKLIRLGTVLSLTGLSRSSVYAYVAAGTFPASVNIGARSVAWVESDVNDWIAARIMEQRKSQRSRAEAKDAC
jgi:prophage regulatory protein